MNQPESQIRNISDTARWVAVYPARETDRPDAVFRDPFARRLAGERGEQIAASIAFMEKNAWPFVARTWLTDYLISKQLRQGADMVINLAAGLDARPYRMELLRSLQWIEVDLPEILAHKEEILGNEKPVCVLERVRLDLSNESARRELFSELSRRANRVLVVAEGLLVYLTEVEVAALGKDLAAPVAFQHWIIDLASPALLRMLARKMGAPWTRPGLRCGSRQSKVLSSSPAAVGSQRRSTPLCTPRPGCTVSPSFCASSPKFPQLTSNPNAHGPPSVFSPNNRD